MKAKVSELEDEVREIFYRLMGKDLNDVVKRLSSKRRFLVRFKYGCEKNMTLNQLNVLTVERTPVIEESKVLTIYVIPDKTIDLEKRHYNSVYILLHFKKGKGFYDR